MKISILQAVFWRTIKGNLRPMKSFKELIERLPENDPRLNRLDICLSNTGVVTGEFGIVASYRRKKEQVVLWREDSRPKVREFAAAFVRRMDQAIASEQRSAEMRRELRMRDYEVESE